MRDIVFYLRHFSDRFHHPREDAAFVRLVEHDPDMKVAIARLIQEHRVIAVAGEELLRRLEDIEADAVVSREAGIALARHARYAKREAFSGSEGTGG